MSKSEVFSKSQIKKTGKKIKELFQNSSCLDFNLIDKEDLDKIQLYRVSHQRALNITFDFLSNYNKKLNKGNITVYRLKRLDTILRKIIRYKNMQVVNMQDIAGCRAIVKNVNQIDSFKTTILNSKKFHIINTKDYINNPPDSGYKSYHIIVKPYGCEETVEIQLRTEEMHYWATLVEITDLLYKVKVKEGEDHPKLYRFHQLLSKKDDIKFDEEKELIELEKELEVFKNAIGIFKINFIKSIISWINSWPTKDEGYLIMEVDIDFKPIFNFFKSFNEAEEVYYQKFTLNEPNMVLICINEPDFEKVGLAYSNYILSSHPSIKMYLQLLIDFIIKNRRLKDINYEKNYKYSIELINKLLETFKYEENSIFDQIPSIFDNLQINNEKKQFIDKWIDNSKNRKDELLKIKLELEKNKPYGRDIKSFWRRFINWLNDY